MSIKDFFHRENLSPLLELPADLREKVFSGSQLALREKYVLANLYYLDSQNKLQEYWNLLPAMADQDLSQCRESLEILQAKGFITLKGNKLVLKIKPLTYK